MFVPPEIKPGGFTGGRVGLQWRNSFTVGADGAGLAGRLLGYKGSLYGTASAGGTGEGVVFKLRL